MFAPQNNEFEYCFTIMSEFPDEKFLLAELRKGEQYAFKHFYDLYQLPLYRRLIRLVHIDIIAEELLQDLFLKIWQKRAMIDPNKSFKAYLYRIAEHLVVDHYRNLARQVKMERDTDVYELEVFDPIEESLQEDRTQKIIKEAIEILPAQQRLIFRLCKIDGKSYEEVSQLLNISHSTINTHITRASKRVRAYIIKHHGTTMSLLYFFALSGIDRK